MQEQRGSVTSCRNDVLIETASQRKSDINQCETEQRAVSALIKKKPFLIVHRSQTNKTW